MTTTIKNEHRYGKDATGILERTNEGAGVYAARCVEMGQLIQVPVLDLWTLMQQESDWSSLLSDGLHLTPKGTDDECWYRLLECSGCKRMFQ
jgi:lysophospholipase L1-like esterase